MVDRADIDGILKSMDSNHFELTVNGETHTIAEGASLAALLDKLSLAGKRIAVERNGEIVPRSRHAECRLEPGDRIEIVHAIGGG